MTEIRGFHAHVYYDAQTIDQARYICEQARDRFSILMGRMHKRLVGPHPCWSCQLSIPVDKFGSVISWLAVNRGDLVVFVHPDTGDDLKDHTQHALWMGQMLVLDLSIFGD